VPLRDELLTSLPEVTSIIHRGDVVVVTGTGEVLAAVTSAVAEAFHRGLLAGRS
jgi:ABC-2 type transport system ATP-binding protein